MEQVFEQSHVPSEQRALPSRLYPTQGVENIQHLDNNMLRLPKDNRTINTDPNQDTYRLQHSQWLTWTHVHQMTLVRLVCIIMII